MIGSAASLNFAAFFDLFFSTLIVVTLITLIEQVILKPDVRCAVYQTFLDVQAKGLAHGQALVEETLGCLRTQVQNRASRVLSFSSTWRNWWTWKRTVIVIQAALGLLVLATFSLPLALALDEIFNAEESLAPEAMSSGAAAPCPEDEIPLAPPMAQILAPVAVFVGGALFNCKAFMRIPLL